MITACSSCDRIMSSSVATRVSDDMNNTAVDLTPINADISKFGVSHSVEFPTGSCATPVTIEPTVKPCEEEIHVPFT